MLPGNPLQNYSTAFSSRSELWIRCVEASHRPIAAPGQQSPLVKRKAPLLFDGILYGVHIAGERSSLSSSSHLCASGDTIGCTTGPAAMDFF
jgi:hypothetical protein